MEKKYSPIPKRLKNVTGDGVTGAEEIIDDNLEKDQSTINQEVHEALGGGGSIDKRIEAAKAEIIGEASDDYNTLGKLENKVKDEAVTRDNAVNTEKERAEGAEEALDGRVDTLEDAVGTGGSVDSRISAAVATETARAQAAEADRYTKSETYTKEEVHNLITTPSQEYVSVTATDQTTAVTDVLPATGAADTTYRVGNWDGTQYNDSVFSEYSWNGSAYIKLSTKSQIGEVYDISANHADTKYADLAAALGTNGANVPQSLQKGGMSVKFVQSSDNKYVQARCMADEFTTDVSQWQGVDDEPTAGSKNLVKSGGIANEVNNIEANINDSILLPQIQGKFIPLAVSIGTVIDVNSPTSNSWYNYSLFQVEKDDVVILNGSGGNDSRLYGILDSTYHLLVVANAKTSAENQRLVMPSNAAYLIINTQNNADYSSYLYKQNSVYRKAEYAETTVIGVSDSAITNSIVKNLFIESTSYSGNVKDLKILRIQRSGSVVTIRLRNAILNDDYNVSGTAPIFEFSRNEGFKGIAIVDISKIGDGDTIQCYLANLNSNVFDKNIGASLLALSVQNGSIGFNSFSDDVMVKVNTIITISNNKNANKYIKNLYIQDNSYSGNIRDLKVSWIQRVDNIVTIRLRDTTLNEDYNIGGNAPLFEFSRNEGFSGIAIVDISELPNNTQIDCNKATLNACVFDKSIKAALLAYSVKNGSVGYDSLDDTLKKIFGSSTDYIGYESITNFVTGKYIEIGSTIGATISLTPTSNSSWEYQIIDVSPNEKYIIRANGGNDPKAYGIIDAENKLLEYSLAADKIENKSQITIPANGAKLIVNSKPSFLSYVLKVVDEVPFLYNPWFGKKVSVLGASHTAAANSWADHAAKLLGFNLYKRAIGGSGVLSSSPYCAILPDGTYVARVGNPSSITSLADLRTYMQGRGYNATEFTDCTYTEYRENPTDYNVTDTDWFVIASKGNAEDRIHTLPQDSDIVVIQFGANDTSQIKGSYNPSGIEMGNVDDYDVSLTNTYYANYKNMLQKIMAWCTNIKRIIILIPDDSTACYVSNTDMTRTDWGKDHDAVKDAIRNLALVYGYEKVEFKNILNYFTVYTLTSDGTHPTAECQKILGEYFANNALNKL